MRSPVKYILLFMILIGLIVYLANFQVVSIRSRRADSLKLNWVTTWPASDTMMGQLPGFDQGPLVFVEHVDLELADDNTLYTANNRLRHLNQGGGIAWEMSVVLDEPDILQHAFYNDVYVADDGDIYALGHLRYFLTDMNEEPTDDVVMTMFLYRFKPDGTLVWEKTWDDDVSGRVWGMGVGTYPDGNVLVIGNCELTIDFDPGDGKAFYENSSNPKWDDPELESPVDDYDGFGLLLDKDGNYIEHTTWPGSVHAVTRTPDNKYIIVGNGMVEQWDDIPEDYAENGTYLAILNEYPDTFSAKPVGIEIDSVKFHALTSDNAGAIYGTGTILDAETSYAVLCKFDSNLDLAWKQSWGSEESENYGLSVATNDSGEVYVGGSFRSTSATKNIAIDFNPGKENDLYAGLLYEMFVVKYSSDGEFLWAGTFGGDRNEWIGDLKIDRDGKILVLGYFQNTIDFDPSPAEALKSTEGDINAFLAQYSEFQK